MSSGYLILDSGEVFTGKYTGTGSAVAGEVVFTTGMCGYVESLTDPSYTGQILVFTYPLIGNYGIASAQSWESSHVQVVGVVLNESCRKWSHHAGLYSLQEWLTQASIPLLTEIDTRALTKLLRSRGSVGGVISTERHKYTPVSLASIPLVEQVSICQKKVYGEGKKRVIAVDCGMKESMIRELMRFPIEIVRVPFDYDYSEEEYDGVFLSNGPGDPMDCTQTIAILQKAMCRDKPIFGVCLGSQMLALAAGARTYKLPFGHRGQNQPCLELETNKCYITSQNHGYAVDESSLPAEWKVTFRNLNDGSVEGIAHRTRPFCSVQFHPEASPGPTDTRWFFEKFWESVER